MKLIKNTGIHYNTHEFLNELEHNKEYWNLHTGRQKKISYHKETQYIPLKTWDVKPGEVQRDCMNTIELDYFRKDFPVTAAFLGQMETRLKGTLAVANYVKLPVGKSVYPHKDHGKFYESHERYHFVIQGIYNMVVEDQEEMLAPGGVYWFENTKTHSVDNLSQYDRIALIFDLKKYEEN